VSFQVEGSDPEGIIIQLIVGRSASLGTIRKATRMQSPEAGAIKSGLVLALDLGLL
jgi:hypothetical protein